MNAKDDVEQDALVLVFSRNAFYKRLHYLALATLLLTFLVIASLISILLYIFHHPPHPLYFAADNVSRLIQVVPVNVENMTVEQVEAWAVEAVEAAYSYDYINYRSQLQNAQKYFTNYGWSKYMEALIASNNLIAVTERKMVGIAEVVGPLKIVAQGILGGAYAFKFQMPVLVTYSYPPFDGKSKFANALQVTVIVQRQPVLQSYKGLGIVQLIGAIVTGNNQPQEISTTPTE